MIVSAPLDEDVLGRLEAAARRRFARWSPRTWQELLDGPGRTLAEGLVSAGMEADRAREALEAYLGLASHGVGLGYLFPSDATGAQGFLDLAWRVLIPRLLPHLPEERLAATLAACWNLGENLESSPGWLRLIFTRVAGQLDSLEDLEALVARVTAQAFAPPAAELHERGRHAWVDLSTEDRRFLPGALHFVAPTVLCVHDRLRPGGGGEPPTTQGIWLPAEGDAVKLGPTGCVEPHARDAAGDADPFWRHVDQQDRRWSEPHHRARNAWRAAAALETSQMVVAVTPA